MREFALVRPTFWIGRTGRWLRTQPPLTTNVALYLITCPNSEMSGLFYVQVGTIAHGLGATEEDIRDTLQSLQNEGFLKYDFDHEAVFIINMARYQLGEYLNPGDKRISGLKRALPAMEGCPFYDEFLEEYGEVYHLEDLQISKPLKPLKPLHTLSKDKDKDKEKEKEKTETRAKRACDFPPALSSERFRTVWETWRQFRTETKHKLTPTTEKKQLEKLASWGEPAAINSIEQSITNGWQGLFEPKQNGNVKPNRSKRDRGIFETPDDELIVPPSPTDEEVPTNEWFD